MDYYKRALELNDETVKNRRYFHTNAETGLHMPMACAYVMPTWMRSQCRKKADFHLPARPEKKHMPADMIFTLPCY